MSRKPGADADVPVRSERPSCIKRHRIHEFRARTRGDYQHRIESRRIRRRAGAWNIVILLGRERTQVPLVQCPR